MVEKSSSGQRKAVGNACPHQGTAGTDKVGRNAKLPALKRKICTSQQLLKPPCGAPGGAGIAHS